MICFSNDFLSESVSFIFEGVKPNGYNLNFVFSITTFLFSVVNLLVIFFIEKISGKSLHKDVIDFKKAIYWCLGAFFVSFILSIVNIIEVNIVSSFVVSLTWMALYEKVHNNVKSTNHKDNPDIFVEL